MFLKDLCFLNIKYIRRPLPVSNFLPEIDEALLKQQQQLELQQQQQQLEQRQQQQQQFQQRQQQDQQQQQVFDVQ